MNQNLKLIIFTFLITLQGCKEVSTQNQIDIKGLWNWEYKDNSKSYLNKTFTVDLNLSGNKLKGRYCAIAKNGARIDCYYKDFTNNIKGVRKKDTIYMGFKGHYDQNSSGKGLLNKKGDLLAWEITKSNGEFYAPKYAELKNGKLVADKTIKQTKKKKVTSCDYSTDCSCEENNSGKSIYEDSLLKICSFNNKTFSEVYKSIYKKENSLKYCLLEELPKKSLLHATSNSYSTQYSIDQNKITIYISQENGGFEFILKKKEGEIILEKHAFAG